MDVFSAITRRRTIRIFRDIKVADHLLDRMVSAARLAPSISNLQPLEYITVNEPKICSELLECLEWNSYDNNETAGENRQPRAYVAVLINRSIMPEGGWHDVGAAVQNMLLVAHDSGLGSCWVREFNREKAAEILGLPSNIELDSVVGVGVPGEAPVTEVMSDSLERWRDERGVMHVPKRQLNEIVHRNKY